MVELDLVVVAALVVVVVAALVVVVVAALVVVVVAGAEVVEDPEQKFAPPLLAMVESIQFL